MALVGRRPESVTFLPTQRAGSSGASPALSRLDSWGPGRVSAFAGSARSRPSPAIESYSQAPSHLRGEEEGARLAPRRGSALRSIPDPHPALGPDGPGPGRAGRPATHPSTWLGRGHPGGTRAARRVGSRGEFVPTEVPRDQLEDAGPFGPRGDPRDPRGPGVRGAMDEGVRREGRGTGRKLRWNPPPLRGR